MSTQAEWQKAENDRTWEGIRVAFAHDWERTKADFGGDEALDMDQDISDIMKQMAGPNNTFENREHAFRFGVDARRQYRAIHPSWDREIDQQLSQQYDGDYEIDRPYIRHAYAYEPR